MSRHRRGTCSSLTRVLGIVYRTISAHSQKAGLTGATGTTGAVTLIQRFGSAPLAQRIGRALERQGLLARDGESSYLKLDPAAGGPMDDLLGHSIT